MQRLLRANRAGFTLVEVLIAAVLLIIGLVGSIALTLGMSRGSKNTRSRDTAYFLAQQLLDQASEVPLAQAPAFATANAGPTCYAMGDDAFLDHPIACGGPAAFYLRTAFCCSEPTAGGTFQNNLPAPGLAAYAANCALGALVPTPVPAGVPNQGQIGGWCNVQVEVTWPTEQGVAVAGLFTNPPANPLGFQNHIQEGLVRTQ